MTGGNFSLNQGEVEALCGRLTSMKLKEQESEMGKLAEMGIIQVWDCNEYCGSKVAYPTAEAFVAAAIGEQVITDEFPEHMPESEMRDAVLPHIHSGYMIHRVSVCEWHDDVDGDWWEYDDEPGPGRSPVWFLDLDEVKGE